jgi:hypothetical protein
MRFVMQKTLFLIVLLALIRTPARADTDTIDLENRTYTPWHYRVRTPQGQFSDWRVVLPGATAQYSDYPQLVLDIWYGAEHSEKYNIRRGSTYAYFRSKPGAAPEAMECVGPGPIRPSPPDSPPSAASSGETCFAPLSKFVAQCKELKQPYRLSLKRLAAECAEAQKTGGGLPAELRYVHGFTWFVGYLVDDANHDVILLGIKDPTRPPVDIDCLATAIKAAYSDSVPRCSLDAHPDPDFQKSVVEGVPWKTRWAEVMIRADYDMKKLAQGHLDPGIDGFKSDLQHSSDVLSTLGFAGDGQWSGGDGKTRNSKNRWWFNFDSQVPRAIGDDAGKVVYLYHNPVRLSTEALVNGSFGSGQTATSARRFAEDFTRHMGTLGKHYPNIAELLAMYRLYDLMRHLRQASRAVPPDMDYWLRKYEHHFEGPPAAMPTLAITRIIRVRVQGGYESFRVDTRGGVVMQLGITPQSLRRAARPAGLWSAAEPGATP